MSEVQALLAAKDTQFKDTHRKMNCGRKLSNVRTPQRISTDLNIHTPDLRTFIISRPHTTPLEMVCPYLRVRTVPL